MHTAYTPKPVAKRPWYTCCSKQQGTNVSKLKENNKRAKNAKQAFCQSKPKLQTVSRKSRIFKSVATYPLATIREDGQAAMGLAAVRIHPDSSGLRSFSLDEKIVDYRKYFAEVAFSIGKINPEGLLDKKGV
jgi:hypothetical protein